MPGGGERLVNFLGAEVLLRLTGEHTDGRLAITEAGQPADADPAPMHIHDKEDETIQVLEGHLIIEVDGTRIDAQAGSVVHIPRGAAQRFWNPGPANARYQSIFSPAGQENYFREAYALVMEADDFDTRLAEIRERYGLRYPAED
ncbi:hypothetical protein Rhow_005962 [Rhodococcus wratislaviensis]|uniref:Cupin type-2 domain-containing protein n=1 Tax=Rhodococcus wratislaviensis TaxID=44752 RepID=A0A402C064_RHOWR|nr:hypothetical protein Rhow_005962 [Rhodococcus wratislaviensis]